jgi:hypothetical protein
MMRKPVFAAKWKIFFFGMKHATLAGWYRRKDPLRADAHRMLAESAETAIALLSSQK